MKPGLRRELHDLALVGAGAIPGALLRWRLQQLFPDAPAGAGPLLSATGWANLLGCLLIGVVLAQAPGRARLNLVLAIGFCGSLTTFSSWMLELAEALQGAGGTAAVVVLLGPLLGGLLLVSLGYGIGAALQRRL